jgi:hypothetical protein
MLLRQGDVFLKKVNSLPVNSQKVINEDTQSNVVLAHGEVTGHKHQIDKASEKVNLWVDGLERYLEVLEESVNLIHEEHYPINLLKGIYKVWLPREYVAPEISRRVID